MLAAIVEEFADEARGWAVESSYEHVDTRLKLAGEDLVEVAERHATITVSSQVKGKAIIFMLEGPADGAFASGTAIIDGNSFTFTDAGLLAHVGNASAAIAAAAAASLIADVFGPVPAESE